LYFDKFETELSGKVQEPTNQAYAAASGEDNLEEPTDDEIDLGL